MKKISIITPCYNEAENLIDCIDIVKKIFNNELKNYDYEHIIVDNNSNQKTFDIIADLTTKDKKVKALINNKNYGAAASSFNAIKYCSGDAVITFLPSDLQDPPELIPEFVKKWEEGFDFVVGIRKDRQEFFLMKWIRQIYYKILKFISNKEIFDGISDYQIIDAKIINEIKKIKHLTFTRILPFEFSDNYTFVNYEWKKRIRGKSKDGIFAYMDTALMGMIYASNNPFRKIFYSGFVVFLAALIYFFYSIYDYFFLNLKTEYNYVFIINILLIFLSINLLVLGFIGEYIVYLFGVLAKNREIIIKQKINFF
jgi:glycosyltransferase involved in cell wall biosynthesis